MEGGGGMLFGRKKEKKTYDPARWQPVLRCSICTGEQAAGFKELGTGRFEEVMLIRSEKDLARFMHEYGLETVTKEY